MSGDNRGMKVLTIHDTGRGQPDFCWGVEGEIAIPSVICDTPGCGCDRSHSGLNSHKASTTVMVREVDLNFDDLVTAAVGFLEAAGWAESADDQRDNERGYQDDLNTAASSDLLGVPPFVAEEVDEHQDEVREQARGLIAHSAEVAADYPVGVVLRPVFDRDRDEWRYTEG